ncbi:MAG: aconitase/3-isopropylmalate dehydratase large subunit family protein [Candidatus Parvarchaeota archaeon]
MTVGKNKTISEKIFSRVTGRDCKAGDYVWAVPELIYIHDIFAPLVIQFFKRFKSKEIKYNGKLIFIQDHIFPPKDLQSAQNILDMKMFSANNGIEMINGGEGIEHTLLIERGVIKPGMFVAGSDSHTVTAGAVGAMGVGLGSTDLAAILAMGASWFMVPESILFKIIGKKGRYITGKDVILEIISRIGVDGANYKSMEISVDNSSKIDMDDRLAIANMTVEAGAKDGIIYEESYGNNDLYVKPDPGATYTHRDIIDLESLRPRISFPYSPGNVHDIKEAVGIKVDQVYIGNCSNGTYSDLVQAATVLKGQVVKNGIKLIIVPATRNIYLRALKSGLIEIFLNSGAIIAPPSCGACAGLHMGVLGKGEVAISNTNRNFRGRMGHPESKVFLANSYVAALAAIEGKIEDPSEVL